jgi:synaptobrevin family protein YKT6
MKVVYVGVYRQVTGKGDVQVVRLAFASHLVDFGYFTRGTIAQHIQFAGRTCIQRTIAGCRQTIQLDEQTPFVAHVYVRLDGLAGIVMADKEYPPRVAFTLVTKEMAAYEERVGVNWKAMEADGELTEAEYLKEDLLHYQDPRKADKLTAIQTQLDEVKDVMHTNIEQLMQRGETLDSLMSKSDDLNSASVQFYKQARKANSCCKY